MFGVEDKIQDNVKTTFWLEESTSQIEGRR